MYKMTAENELAESLFLKDKKFDIGTISFEFLLEEKESAF